MDKETKVFIANFHEFWDEVKKKEGHHPKICPNFREFWGEDQKQIIKKVFISKNAPISSNSGIKARKTRVFIAKSAKKQFLLPYSGVITSILKGLELYSSGTKPVTFFGAQFSLEEGDSSCLGRHKQ